MAILNYQKGAALLLTLLILTVILTIAFGVTTLMIGELKISRETFESLKAYSAAEAGIERALYEERYGSGASNVGNPPECSSESGAECIDASNSNCYSISVDGSNITSYGCYKGTRRAIGVSWEL